LSQSVHDFARKVRRKLGLLLGQRQIGDVWPQGVVSFTFDDFPKTAFTVGGAILERHGARGTYYTASKLAGTEGDLGPLFETEDLRAAHHNGHEIACHTHTHLRCSEADGPTLVSEVKANAAGISAIIKDFVPTNFAFPYGATSPTARQVMKRYYASCRGNEPGINRKIPDTAELFAYSVYAGTFSESQMRGLIDKNRSVGGWLIFYTHDVTSTPSPFGCTPEQWDAVVSYAAKTSPILPVRDVMSALSA
jgi:peptidoglycan/xylan/chitin deacetylase (PgdA/CDA1 family)